MGITLWQHLSNASESMAQAALSEASSRQAWTTLRPVRHREFLQDLGLFPLPQRCGLCVTDHGGFSGAGYQARRIAFQILPDCWSTAHVYYPDPAPPVAAPAVLYVCGHAPIGSWYYQSHAILWARRGFVCLILDTVEQHDGRGEHHGSLVGQFEAWLSLGYTPAGAEVWNAMRAADVLCADPRVDARRLAITGVSGGGACSFHTACADDRFVAVSTLCGISSPLDAIGNRHVQSQCDCMFPHNLFARDISEYAALIAPRAAQFCFAEQDQLYHPAECVALVERARKVWRLLGCEDRCRTIVRPGPHGDQEAFDQATQQWFDQHVSGVAKPLLERGPRVHGEQELSVLQGNPPSTDQLPDLPTRLTPRGSIPLPSSVEDWPRVRRGAITRLAEMAPSLLSEAPSAALNADGRWDWGGSGRELQSFRGQIGGLDIALQYVATGKQGSPLVLSLACEGENLMHALERVGRAVTPEKMAYGSFEPRVAGVNALASLPPPSPPGSGIAPQSVVLRRAMAVAGTTPVAMTVADVRVAMDCLLRQPELAGSPIILLGRGDMAVAALYAGLIDERISGLLLLDLPSSHLQGGAILGVLRALDIPQALGLMAPRPVALVNAGHQFWTWPRRAYERLACPQRLVFANELRPALSEVLSYAQPLGATVGAALTGASAHASQSVETMVHDLNAPEFNPPDCPAWAKEDLPPEMLPYRGRNGMPAVYRARQYPLGREVVGIDRYHANQAVMVRPETLEFLYSRYTPTTVSYPRGLLPTFEAVAAEVTAGCSTPIQKALALLTRGVSRVRHPGMPPCGPPVRPDRGLDDESLLRSGAGWCNEQVRVFIRLCQVSGIPARLVHVFYADERTGHCVAEFYAEQRWCMADCSWFCVFPGDDGRLLSAAQCFDRGPGQQACGRALHRRFQELLSLPVEELNFASPQAYQSWRREYADLTPQQLAARMNVCSIINYPLPAASPGASAHASAER